MAPIHTVPPEILLKIFFQGIAGQEYVVAEREVAPWVLTQVCKYWRHLAVVAPELWCSFAIDTEHMNHSIVKMMSTWIGRSQNLPLTVALSISPDEEAILDEDACRSAFSVLAQHIRRWKDIHFTWTGHDLRPLADPLGHGQISTPLLESFGLDTTMFSNGVEGPHLEAYVRHVLQDALVCTLLYGSTPISSAEPLLIGNIYRCLVLTFAHSSWSVIYPQRRSLEFWLNALSSIVPSSLSPSLSTTCAGHLKRSLMPLSANYISSSLLKQLDYSIFSLFQPFASSASKISQTSRLSGIMILSYISCDAPTVCW